MPERSGATLACEHKHKEATMSQLTAISSIPAPAVEDRQAADDLGRHGWADDHPWIWVLLEAFANAGAAFDPAAALAARRWAGNRDESLRSGRR
jgi:hypothetical protein